MTKKKNAKSSKPRKWIYQNSVKSESEERIDWGSGKSNQFSDELKSDNQQILEDTKDNIIMSESACFSDIQYCQTLSTSLLQVDHWTRVIFLIFEGFWLITCRSIHHKNVPCEILYISMSISMARLRNSQIFSQNQKGNRTKHLRISETSHWNRHRNIENFTRNILVMDGSTGDEPKPLKNHKYDSSPVIHL